jgi:hypothetical protein
LRELLLWCLPALVCGALARGMLIVHFPYGYIHPDTPDFLVTADRFLFHHRFVLHSKKAFLGPILFLLPMVVKIPSLLIIPWAQHFFGLIYTVMVGALVRCWTAFWKWWIVPATLLATLNPAALYYEHALIAESQYLWCVTALVLAGSAYALEQSRGRFVLLLLALLLTAGSRPVVPPADPAAALGAMALACDHGRDHAGFFAAHLDEHPEYAGRAAPVRDGAAARAGDAEERAGFRAAHRPAPGGKAGAWPAGDARSGARGKEDYQRGESLSAIQETLDQFGGGILPAALG